MLTEQMKFTFGALFALANRLQILGDQIDPDISIKQWLFLAVMPTLGPAPTISAIARTTGSSHQNVKKMASALEKRGFIRLYKDAKDARVTRAELTDKCAAFFAGRDAAATAFIQRLFLNFSDSDMNGLFVGLQKLTENVTTMENTSDAQKKE